MMLKLFPTVFQSWNPRHLTVFGASETKRLSLVTQIYYVISGLHVNGNFRGIFRGDGWALDWARGQVKPATTTRMVAGGGPAIDKKSG